MQFATNAFWNTCNLQNLQKIVIKIILEHRYSDYHQGCLLLGISTLPQRRVKLCLNFVLKCLTNAKFKNLFKLNTNTNIRNPDKYDIPLARTTRYFNSPLLFITRLLNSHFKNVNNSWLTMNYRYVEYLIIVNKPKLTN